MPKRKPFTIVLETTLHRLIASNPLPDRFRELVTFWRRKMCSFQKMNTVQYATHSGYGNQMQALLTAVFIAHVANRSLTLPPMLPHDFIKIDGSRQCHVDQGFFRQGHILRMQKTIGNPYKWDSFARIFEIPVHYSMAQSSCVDVHPVVRNLTCGYKNCASSVSAIISISDKNLCLGALNEHHTNLLRDCSVKYTLARQLWNSGLTPKRVRTLRNCTCEYARLSDHIPVPGKMSFGDCPFECVNDVWRDQVCCATCSDLKKASTSSSFWQQVRRLHRQYKTLV